MPVADDIDMSGEGFSGHQGNQRDLGGRPRHEPTEKQRNDVEVLSGQGASRRDIAAFVGIARTTLEEHYARELLMGRLKANSKVAAAQLARASDVNHPQGTQAAIWWEKTRADMKEPKGEITHSGAIGTFDAVKLAERLAELSDEEVTDAERLLGRIFGGGPGASSAGASSGDSEEGG